FDRWIASKNSEVCSRPEIRGYFRPSLAAGYGERQVLEIVLALAVKTLSNYANHLFHTPLDEMFADRAWQQI
ncbi:hypothetical protein N0018_34145, partial [Pseudomonas aeruginosa]|nr:hypothetical protein [Pseudomonas aeruginosa]